MTIWQLINTGGFVVYVLLFCSVLSITVILERMIYYRRKSGQKREDFMKRIRSLLELGDFTEALRLCEKSQTCFSAVARAGIELHRHSEKELAHAMERQIIIENMQLERYSNLIGTIGSTAVYIGLLGTVLGIMRAFQDISTKGAGGINTVINGIAEALVCTAVGLCVAVPAVVAYNYFVKKINTITTDMELCYSEISDLLLHRKR